MGTITINHSWVSLGQQVQVLEIGEYKRITKRRHCRLLIGLEKASAAYNKYRAKGYDGEGNYPHGVDQLPVAHAERTVFMC